MNDVVLYTFAGRAENMELQMPLYQRVLEENPNVRLDVWNLTKLFRDSEYVKRIRGDRIRVRNDFYKIRPWWKRFDHVWRHYAKPEYKGTHFVKIDDDVLFWQPDRFAEFVKESYMAPGVITSALTINNGASIAHTPGMAKEFKKLKMPLLDVHLHGRFAEFAHEFAQEHWDELLQMTMDPRPTEDWMSINMIAYDWETGCRVAQELGNPHPEEIAGRTFGDGFIGDEGSCNLQHRMVLQGFLAAHLTFGPQELPKEQWQQYRKWYAEAGRRYLER